MRRLRWLVPGLRVKRWLLLLALGMALVEAGLLTLLARAGVALALAHAVARAEATATASGWGPWVGAALGLGGALLTGHAASRLMASVMGAVIPVRPETSSASPGHRLADALYRQRGLERGPRVVVLGGGTGLPVLLRGLKAYTANITALVTVSDDGGSSGRLRGELGILPPGDLRNCLLALAETEPLMEELLQHRFQNGEGLAGHAFGNLFIAAMCEITGDFGHAIRQSSRVLAVRGQVLPVTLQDVRLGAELEDGTVVVGESAIPAAGRSIRRVFLTPSHPAPPPEAVRAIAEADLVILGPGSLYTSVLPNLLVPEVAEAIRRSPALKVYVVNIMTQPGETAGMDAVAHVRAILDHAPGVVDVALVNSAPVPPGLRERYRQQGAEPVTPPERPVIAGVRYVAADLLAADGFVRHDPDKLARACLRLMLESGQGRERRRAWDDFWLAVALRQGRRLAG